MIAYLSTFAYVSFEETNLRSVLQSIDGLQPFKFMHLCSKKGVAVNRLGTMSMTSTLVSLHFRSFLLFNGQYVFLLHGSLEYLILINVIDLKINQ